MKRLGLILLSLAIVCGCTSQPAQQEQKQPPESLSGRSAFQRLYVAAHGWAGDARPYQLQSQAFGDAKGTDGKAAVWRARRVQRALRVNKRRTAPLKVAKVERLYRHGAEARRVYS